MQAQVRKTLVLFIAFQLLAQTAPALEERSAVRSFNDIFSRLPSSIRAEAFSDTGYSISFVRQKGADSAGLERSIYARESGIDPHIITTVLAKQPGFLIESFLVIPHEEVPYSLLDVYNALGKVRGLKGRLYHSHNRQEYVSLFEEVTRIESARKNTPVDDPAPALRIPPSETVYMRLKDVNFGNSFYRGEMTLVQNGLLYSLSNNRNLTYLFIPVIKEEKFTAYFYFEPIAEGVLIYSLAGADVSDFVASKIDMPSAISKRLAVIINWIADGIRGSKS